MTSLRFSKSGNLPEKNAENKKILSRLMRFSKAPDFWKRVNSEAELASNVFEKISSLSSMKHIG